MYVQTLFDIQTTATKPSLIFFRCRRYQTRSLANKLQPGEQLLPTPFRLVSLNFLAMDAGRSLLWAFVECRNLVSIVSISVKIIAAWWMVLYMDACQGIDWRSSGEPWPATQRRQGASGETVRKRQGTNFKSLLKVLYSFSHFSTVVLMYS